MDTGADKGSFLGFFKRSTSPIHTTTGSEDLSLEQSLKRFTGSLNPELTRRVESQQSNELIAC